jgi:predicted lactoylglutathione lyase
VVVPVKNRRYLNPNSRFTLEVESIDELEEAHREFTNSASEAGITEVGELMQLGETVSFFLSDPDRNWWEITAEMK